MYSKAAQEALDQLKSGIEMLESNLKIVLNELQTAQDDLVILGNTLRKNLIDEECRVSVKRLRDICKPGNFAPALEQLHTETGVLVRQEEVDLAGFEERYTEQAKKQVAILLKVSTAQEMVDRAKELLSGQPATYQTNAAGDEALPQAWRS
ncbi:hypothetical protein LTS10_011803 [Elasticomyces elasticus]|nr:hypothetical protein LTS10_011803 [Elasticomyces elasticus]